MDEGISSTPSSETDRQNYLEDARRRVTSLSQSAVADLNYRYERAVRDSTRDSRRIGF
jgi:hypothetical protein